jgi:hypothetical protein
MHFRIKYDEVRASDVFQVGSSGAESNVQRSCHSTTLRDSVVGRRTTTCVDLMVDLEFQPCTTDGYGLSPS